MNKEKNAHLLLGPEIGQKQEFVDALFLQAQKSDPAIERYKFYPYDAAIHEIINIIETPGLFQSARFLQIANIEDFKAVDMEKLLIAITHMSSSVWVVLFSTQNQAPKIHKKLEHVIPAKNRRIFWEMFENRKHEWINEFFTKEGIKIAPDAIDKLLVLVENNTQELRVACEALAGFFENQAMITEENVSTFVIHSREESVYSLFFYILNTDLVASCDCLLRLAMSPESIGVQTLTGLLWQFRKVLKLKELLEAGISIDLAAKQVMILGKHQIQLYHKATKKYSMDQLHIFLREFCVYDGLLRSNYPRDMQRILIENFILMLCLPPWGTRPTFLS
ncbi:MAG: DNA polymerase III subunit delta [Spirochaetia bacterium]